MTKPEYSALSLTKWKMRPIRGRIDAAVSFLFIYSTLFYYIGRGEFGTIAKVAAQFTKRSWFKHRNNLLQKCKLK